MDAPWPARPRWIGSRVAPADGAARVSGTARGPADLALPGLLHAALVVCPHARARVVAIDADDARRLPGFRALIELRKKGDETFFAGAAVVAVAADTAAQAADAARAVKVTYDRLPWTVREDDALKKDARTAPPAGAVRDRANRRPAAAVESRGFEEAAKAAPLVAPSTLRIAAALADRPVAAVARWAGDTLSVWADPGASAATLADHFALGPAAVASRGEGAEWLAVAVAELARQAKRPVRLASSGRTRVLPGLSSSARVGGKKDGTILTLDADVVQGDGPAVLLPATYAAARRVRPTVLRLNRDEEPSAAALGATVAECAADDFAAAAGVDPLEVRRKSLPPDSPFLAPLDLAAKLCGWADAWHPPGKTDGPLKRGLGLAIHDTPVAGSGRASAAVTVYPDGSVVLDGPAGAEAVLVAEALGIPPRDVEVRPTRPAAHPDSVARAVWAAAVAARAEVQMKAGIVTPWRSACARLGKEPVKGEAEELGTEVRSAPGAVAAEVRVDAETGVVRVTRVVVVQEAGRVVERLSAEAEVERRAFAAVGRALCEEVVFDRETGRPVGGPARLRLADAPRVEVTLIESAAAVLSFQGETAAAAAVSNAVFNAIGVRVAGLPLTPDRVLAALAKGV